MLGCRLLCKSGESCLTSTVLMGPLRLLVELRPLFGSSDGGVVVVQTLWHPLTDDVHQPLEGLLHVNVIFSARFKELKTCREGGAKRLCLHSLLQWGACAGNETVGVRHTCSSPIKTTSRKTKSSLSGPQTHPTDPTAAGLSEKPPLVHPPCHTYSPPAGPGHCPTSTSWSEWTCEHRQQSIFNKTWGKVEVRVGRSGMGREQS